MGERCVADFDLNKLVTGSKARVKNDLLLVCFGSTSMPLGTVSEGADDSAV